MVDDDVRLADINKAVLIRCIPLQAVLDHCDLGGGHKLRHDLAEVDLGVGVLVDLVPLGDRIDEIALGFGGEPVPRLASLSLASVEVVRVPIAIHVGDGHGGTSIRWSRLCQCNQRHGFYEPCVSSSGWSSLSCRWQRSSSVQQGGLTWQPRSMCSDEACYSMMNQPVDRGSGRSQACSECSGTDDENGSALSPSHRLGSTSSRRTSRSSTASLMPTNGNSRDTSRSSWLRSISRVAAGWN